MVTAKQVIALTLCAIGLLIIIAYTDGKTTVIGIVAVLLAALSWSLGNLVVKKADTTDVLAFIVWSAPFSVIPLLLVAWVVEGGNQIYASVHNLSVNGWLVVLWQSLGNTLIGYGLWNLLLVRYSAVEVTPWALLVPIFGMAASSIILGETMPWWKLLAVGFILSGLALNMRGQNESDHQLGSKP
jgi:O-acetylserine/cysteine efflux transporter